MRLFPVLFHVLARSRTTTRRLAPWLLLLLAATGCLYDGRDKCGAHQRVDDKGYCVCAEGARWDPATVTCAPPVQAPDAGADPGGPGLACSASAPCASPTFSTCHASKAGDSYCTKTGCTAHTDCPTGFFCDKSFDPALCRRAATGQNKACATSADCRGGDATLCPGTMLPVCVVEDCSLTASGSCDQGWTCCDVGKLAGFPKNICLPSAGCP